jgi:hypothetical protein
MKSLRFESILLVSHKERAAKRVQFHPETTVVKGQNDTGKSSVVKSLYYALGAEPHGIHKRWKEADVAVLLRFRLDGVPFSMYRHRDSFTLFDDRDLVLSSFGSVTNELGPALAELFDFKLRLPNREGTTAVPPPAYLFVPFYVDQDKGWIAPWNSFAHLSQFANWRSLTAGYHFGLRPDRWYELDADRKRLLASSEEPGRNVRVLDEMLQRTAADTARPDFDTSFDRFKGDVEELLVECERLRKEEDRYRSSMVALHTERQRLEEQLAIVAHTHDELSADYKFADKANDSVACPTCGATYANSFSERFHLARDTETCAELLQSLRKDQLSVQNELTELEASLGEALLREARVSELLTKRQGEVQLRDLIRIEGKQELATHLRAERTRYQQALLELDQQSETLRKEMLSLDRPERRRAIVDEYAEDLRKNAGRLSVSFFTDQVFKRVDASIDESGSDQPRAVLAYTFAALSSIERSGNATFCPITVDAPNQQEQDPENLKRILSFIVSYRPPGRQLIVGLVDDAQLNFGGSTIELTEKRRLLSKDYYREGADQIRYYEAKNLDL